MSVPRGVAVALVTALLSVSGCAGPAEQALERDLERAARQLAAAPEPGTEPAAPTDLDGGLAAYVAYALETSPQLQASFERWRAAVLSISRSRQLPEPTISYGYYILNAETRVGPQRHRLSLQQTFPWPTKLSAGADAAAARARVHEQRFEAEAVALRQRIADAYYALWLVRRAREVEREQLEVLGGLAEAARARVSTGQASFADVQQLDVAVSRLADTIAGRDEQERAAAAALVATIGAPAGTPTPTPDEPYDLAAPRESPEQLRAAALAHPYLATFELLGDASREDARARAAERLPSFTVGLDWIEVGPARMDGVADSGKDTLVAGIGLRVPLWQASYADSVRAAEAEAAAHRADGRAARDRAAAELDGSLAAIDDAARRARLYERTLAAQVEAAYESVVGAYVVGQSNVSALLLIQRELLEVELGGLRARVDHARAWARLENVVGRPVEPAAGSEEEASD